MDYNIYLHSIEQASAFGAFTKPWSNEQQASSPTSAWKQDQDSSASTPDILDSIESIARQGLNVLAKSVPEIAIGLAIVTSVKTAASMIDTGIETCLPYYEASQGDYMLGIQYHNIKTALNSLTHPTSAINDFLLNQLRTIKNNERKAMQRELLGDSLVNTYTNRGV